MTHIFAVTQEMTFQNSEMFEFSLVSMQRVYAIHQSRREILGPTMRKIAMHDLPHQFTQLVREEDRHWYDWGHGGFHTWLELYNAHALSQHDQPDPIRGAYARFAVIATEDSCCTAHGLPILRNTDLWIAQLSELQAANFLLSRKEWQAEVKAAKERIEKARMAKKEASHVG
jgi:hypothetical protein